MPGQPDVWNTVALPSRVSSVLSAPFRSREPGRRRVTIAASAAALAVLAGGTAAYGVAHKTITLDVDGEISRVTTFAGSVDGVLDDQGIEVGDRDTVAPAAPSALRDGSEIVVRHATLVTAQVDGVATDVWTTALDADEALTTLATRGGDVRLVASRSAGRAELPIDLALDGPVEVRVDGQVLEVADGSRGLAAVLDQLGLTLGELDQVSVARAGGAKVAVVINRVVVQDVPELQPIPFAVVEQPDPNRFEGSKKVTTAGVEGQRTLVHRITTVDGLETARELVTDAVTAAPVDKVVAVGTKERPAAPAPARSAPSAGSGSSGPVNPNVGGDADSLNWAALAACESGGRPDAVSSTGKYHGLYQFSVATWNGVGGSGLPSQASPDEQTMRAKMLYNRSGAGQWPSCGPRLFS